jgi:hypothetical protein
LLSFQDGGELENDADAGEIFAANASQGFDSTQTTNGIAAKIVTVRDGALCALQKLILAITRIACRGTFAIRAAASIV